MYAAQRTPPQLVDRLSWCWLIVGTMLLPFTAYQLVLPLATWLAPILLLRFVRTQRTIVALPIIALVYFVGMTLAFGDILPPPMNYLVGGLGMVAVAPYAADRLLGVRLTGVARTLVFPLTITIVDWLVAFGPLGAATTAVSVAVDPPEVSSPPVPAGMPSHCRNQSSTTSSSSLGPDATVHTPAKKLYPVASQSPITDGKVGMLGT